KELGKSVVFAKLVSNAAAKAAETGSNTGILVVRIIDANGLPVVGATVTVTNPDTGVSVVGITNASGYLVVAGLPPNTQNGYHLVATKDGFSTDYTTARTAQNPNQVQPDVDILAQQVTTQTLAIDRLATLTVAVRNELGALVFGNTVTATSSKITQFNPDLAKNIYSQPVDASGNAIFTNIEWDSYSLVAFPQSGSSYLVTTIPYQKVTVPPNSATNATMIITTDPSWPRIESVDPIAATVGQTINIQIEGSNFPVGITTVKLSRTGYADVLPTLIDITANEKTITATFNFTGVATGIWDLIVDVGGKIINQIGGFTVS
ncbi:MAG: carboxypeptidase-like regulatory domain-containing protein, partial [Patescibacteria group bacterium]